MVPTGDLPNVGIDRWVALEYGDEERDERADEEEGDEELVGDSPSAARKRGESHIKQNDGDFDERKGDVEQEE